MIRSAPLGAQRAPRRRRPPGAAGSGAERGGTGGLAACPSGCGEGEGSGIPPPRCGEGVQPRVQNREGSRRLCRTLFHYFVLLIFILLSGGKQFTSDLRGGGGGWFNSRPGLQLSLSVCAALMLRFPPKDGTGCLSHFLGILFFIPWGAQLLAGTAVNLSLFAFIHPWSVVDLYSVLVKKAACCMG